VLAGGIFLAYRLLDASPQVTPDRIEIGAARIEQLAGLYAKTWQRPPTAAELKGLVDEYVKEEIYYREALALGLDKDDTVIRRRLRQKMEFLLNADFETLQPSDAELNEYLKANAEQFRVEPMLAFQQIFVSREKHGAKVEDEARAILEMLRRAPGTDPPTVGDQTLLPPTLSLTTISAIGQTFGSAFAKDLQKIASGQWDGPILSSYGLHLVRIVKRREERLPPLAEIRSAVVREFTNAKRNAMEQERFDTLLKQYPVVIEGPPNPGAEP
jgi:hypothetical protein